MKNMPQTYNLTVRLFLSRFFIERLQTILIVMLSSLQQAKTYNALVDLGMVRLKHPVLKVEVGPSLGSSSRLKPEFRLAVFKLKARA
jgi:hypothetical protein